MPRRVNDAIELVEQAAPATPAAGIVRVYAKTSGLLYSLDDAGLETPLGGGGGAGIPVQTTAPSSPSVGDLWVDSDAPAGGGGGGGAGLATTVVSETSFALSAAVGVAETLAREDHTHGSPANPLTAHEAHGDPHAGYLLESVVSGLATPAIVLGSAAAAGTGTTPIHHNATIAAFDATAPSTQAFGDAAVVGTAAFAARRDHKHAMPAAPTTTRILRFVFDGGGVALTTGAKKVYMTVPAACTITKWRILPDVSGSVVFDIWKDTYANFPPTVADTITASAKPTLSAANKAESTTLTGWTTALAAGDIIEVNVDSATTVTKAYLDLYVTV